ncbi:helix-turn-helix domain-containing protein [Burkholderia ubonensis]|uniref:helix-turn-helix domain-containing protein n=1 Tax=Burkholderia ubonensis TaxID=101571 RepID=UPI00358F80DA
MIGLGDRKFIGSEHLGSIAEWPDFLIERRKILAGEQADFTAECVEVVVMLAGRSVMQRVGNGERQGGVALPGMAWISPMGIYEREIVLTDPADCLHIYLPPALVQASALQDYDLNPDLVELAYAGRIADPMLHQIATGMAGCIGRKFEVTDRLFLDGMRTTLAACLMGSYTVDRWKRPESAPTLDARRLRRVLAYIEAHLADELTLDRLAAEACLSAFHFSRLFKQATGLSPHRYVTDQRVQAAQAQLAKSNGSLVEIALDHGFGSQDNFTRVFRKSTGLTPGEYRELRRRG